jgi:hypothetical protein
MLKTKHSTFIAQFDQSEQENKKNAVRLRKRNPKSDSKSSMSKVLDDEKLVQPIPVLTPQQLFASLNPTQLKQIPSNGLNPTFYAAIDPITQHEQVNKSTETAEPTEYREIKKRKSFDHYKNDESNV